MTKYPTSTDLITALTTVGMLIDDRDTTTYRSPDQMAVSEAQIVLLRRGYGPTGSTINDRGEYELVFTGFGGERITLVYVHGGQSHRPHVALCYIGESNRLEQYTVPYRWSATDPLSEGGKALLEAFTAQFGRSKDPVWVPILRYSPIVKY